MVSRASSTVLLATLFTLLCGLFMPARADSVDNTVKKIRTALDLSSVSHDTLRAVLLRNEHIDGEAFQYLTVASDTVNVIDVGLKLKEKHYLEAVKSAGNAGGKKVLTKVGLSSVSTMWTAVELSIDGCIFLVERMNANNANTMIHSYVIRRSRGETDDEAWFIIESTPLGVLPAIPLGTPEEQMAEETTKRTREIYQTIHDTARLAWEVYQAMPAAERNGMSCGRRSSNG